MEELIKNSINTLKYNVLVDGELTAATDMTVTISKNGLVVVAATPVTAESAGVYKFVVPTDLTGVEGVLDVTWSFTIGSSLLSIDEQYVVVTPYCSWLYFKPEGTNTTPTYADFVESERVARFIINTYCAQTFGYEENTLPVEGHGEDGLPLNRRLLSLEKVSWFNNNTIRPGDVIGLSDPDKWEVVADGWVIRRIPSRTKIDPVYNPAPKFKRNITYMVSGFWGWKTVPTEVQEASKILVADLLCQDHKYRDKYIQSFSTAGTRMQFSDLTWEGTGNALADELLRNYRIVPSIGMI